MLRLTDISYRIDYVRLFVLVDGNRLPNVSGSVYAVYWSLSIHLSIKYRVIMNVIQDAVSIKYLNSMGRLYHQSLRYIKKLVVLNIGFLNFKVSVCKLYNRLVGITNLCKLIIPKLIYCKTIPSNLSLHQRRIGASDSVVIRLLDYGISFHGSVGFSSSAIL